MADGLGTAELSSLDLNAGSDLEEFAPRRIRHITSIQVRNLTPFPVRDAFTSALSQPSARSQFTAHGHLSDDLDATLSRKRGRRVSSNSVNTLKSFKSEERGDRGVDNREGTRKRTASRVSFPDTASLSPSSPGFIRPSAAPTIRPNNRTRTTSMASSFSAHLNSSTSPGSAGISAASMSLPTILPDHSQRGLERVLNSRLVETFLAISVPATNEQQPKLPFDHATALHGRVPGKHPNAPVRNPPAARDKTTNSYHRSDSSTSTSRKGPKATVSSDSANVQLAARRESSASVRLNSNKSSSSHSSSKSTSSLRLRGKSPSSSSTPQKPSTIYIPSPLQSSPPLIPSSPSTITSPSTPIPDYLSSIHRPSTNPNFPIDAHLGRDFSERTDSSGERLKVELWGKVRSPVFGEMSISGKGKEKEISLDSVDDGSEWKIVQEWDLHLSELTPLPEELASHSSHLPYNTLLITLSPPGRTYYIPTYAPSSRSPSPLGGYNSDPESEIRKVRPSGGLTHPTSPKEFADSEDVVHVRRKRTGAVKAAEGQARTACWQDLFKLVTLQSCILDTEESLSDIVHEIDNIIQSDTTSVLKRGVSELDFWVQELRAERNIVKEKTDQLKSRIEARKKQLRQRRNILSKAKQQYDEVRSYQDELETRINEERERLVSLRSYFPPIRTTLLTSLSFIYPIELVSPPDLLFSVLDVPLPIPLSPTDPAPPLSLHSHKDVTEDAVATALGYAAQVVQLLAAYLGKALVYPVTCVGSRSLIRDGISAMVGPRMFPLFSKGVDTYRFEYGVFLLNKDIELLMADRDLRALDMRHTLPNLKNLLLTLSSGEGVQPRIRGPLDSPISSVSGLESPPRAESPPALNVDIPEAPTAENDSSAENNTPPTSGSVTPTLSATDISESSPWKSRPFLGLSPFAGFLRGRYPSSSRQAPMKPVAEISEERETAIESAASATALLLSHEQDVSEDDEDRRTIRGVTVGDSVRQEVEKTGNGHPPEDINTPGQKEKGGVATSSLVSAPQLVNHVT